MKDNRENASRIARHANTRLSANGVLCHPPHEPRPSERARKSKIRNRKFRSGKFGTNTKILKTPLSIKNFQPADWDSCPISRAFRPSHGITRESSDCAAEQSDDSRVIPWDGR